MYRGDAFEESADRAEEAYWNSDSGKGHGTEHEDVLDDACPGRPAQSRGEDEKRHHDQREANRGSGVVGTVSRDPKQDLQAAELDADVGHDHDKLQERDAHAKRAAIVASLEEVRAG